MLSQHEEQTDSETGEAGRSAGASRILDERFTELYNQIRRLASRVRWNGSNPTLNPTALAHEAYLKLRKDSLDVREKSYDQVIAIFANAMHQILIDAARRKGAQKRSMGPLPEKTELPIEDALSIATAIEELQRENSAQGQIAQCRFLLGMTVDETAAALGISKRAVERQWAEAKTQLSARIGPAKK